jgi:hypothetical protein
MFLVTEADTVAVRAALQDGGDLAAAAEVRKRFLGVTDAAAARTIARIIAGWAPLPIPSSHAPPRPPA